MTWLVAIRSLALVATASAFLVLLPSGYASAAGAMVLPGGELDPAHPDAEIYLSPPRAPTLPSGAACRVAKRYVDLVNAGRFAEVAELYSEDATFLEPVRPGLQGIDAIRDFYTQRIGRFQPRVAPVSFVGNDTECMMELAMEMPVEGRPRWLLVSIDHFVLDDEGKVALMVVFARPPTTAMRALMEPSE